MTTDGVRIEIACRAPFDWAALLKFIAARAIDGVERVDADAYRRTLRVAHGAEELTGWIEIESVSGTPRLGLFISSSLAAAVDAIRRKVEHLVDAHCDSAQVNAVLGDLASPTPGLRVPGAIDGFELAVRAILGQQITVRAARTLAGRFAATLGQPVTAPGLTVLFPRPQDVARRRLATIAKLGVVAMRAQAIIDIARALRSGELALHPGADVQDCIDTLKSIRGVGEWTAQYIAMRALGWRDAFPHSDLALLKAMGLSSPGQALRMAERWRPWRAYAVMHLWRSLGSPDA